MDDEIHIKILPYSTEIMEVFAIYGQGIIGVDSVREEFPEISPQEVKSLTKPHSHLDAENAVATGMMRLGGVRSRLSPPEDLNNRSARRARAARNRKPRP